MGGDRIDVALIAKLRSGPLYRYRKEHGYSQKRAAEISGVTHGAWNRCECMAFKGVGWETIATIAAAVGIAADELCPPELRGRSAAFKEEVQYREVQANQMLVAEQSRRLTLPDASEEAQRETDAGELREAMRKVLRTLTYRQREIIKLRYGLEDGYCYTLEDVGKIFKVTREVIRQVEAKAIRKMQQPIRARTLEVFVDNAHERESDELHMRGSSQPVLVGGSAVCRAGR